MGGDGVQVGGQDTELSELGLILNNGTQHEGQITAACTGGSVRPQKLMWFLGPLISVEAEFP